MEETYKKLVKAGAIVYNRIIAGISGRIFRFIRLRSE